MAEAADRPRAAAIRVHRRTAAGIFRHEGGIEAGEGAAGGYYSPEEGIAIPWRHPDVIR